MKCPNCGADSNAKFCEHCGTSIETAQVYNEPFMAKKPIFKKWWFWVIIAVIVLGIIGSFSNDKTPTKDTGAKSTSTSSKANSVASKAKENFSIGETATFKTMKITAEEMKESNGKEYFEAPEGKVFVGVKFTIENISEKDQSMSSILLFDAYTDGVKSDFSFTASMAFDEGTIDGTVAPGKKLVGWYAVEAPKDWKEIELQIKSSWLSSGKAIFVINK